MFVHEGESLKHLINNIADLGLGKWFVAVFTVLIPLFRNILKEMSGWNRESINIKLLAVIIQKGRKRRRTNCCP